MARLIHSLLLISFFGMPHSVNGEEFTGAAGDYKVDLPGIPRETIAVDSGVSLSIQAILRDGKNAFMVSSERFESARLRSVDANQFVSLVQNQITKAFGADKVKIKEITHQGLNGYELRIGSGTDPEQMRMRLFFANRVGYKILVAGSDVDTTSAASFFDSFTLLKSDPIQSSHFIRLADPAAQINALMLPHARGIALKPKSESEGPLYVLGANGPTQYYGVLHQEAKGIAETDVARTDSLTKQAINAFTDGDGKEYQRSSVRTLSQDGLNATELEYRMASDQSRLLVRRLVHSGRVYWAFVGWKEGREDPVLAKRFLDGFRIQKK